MQISSYITARSHFTLFRLLVHRKQKKGKSAVCVIRDVYLWFQNDLFACLLLPWCFSLNFTELQSLPLPGGNSFMFKKISVHTHVIFVPFCEGLRKLHRIRVSAQRELNLVWMQGRKLLSFQLLSQPGDRVCVQRQISMSPKNIQGQHTKKSPVLQQASGELPEVVMFLLLCSLTCRQSIVRWCPAWVFSPCIYHQNFCMQCLTQFLLYSYMPFLFDLVPLINCFLLIVLFLPGKALDSMDTLKDWWTKVFCS